MNKIKDLKEIIDNGFAYEANGSIYFDVLKYNEDFTKLDYVNAEAPKGGEISTWAFGTFDSLNRYIIKGNAAASGNIFLETLMK